MNEVIKPIATLILSAQDRKLRCLHSLRCFLNNKYAQNIIFKFKAKRYGRVSTSHHCHRT